jgi:hypothetical protein
VEGKEGEVSAPTHCAICGSVDIKVAETYESELDMYMSEIICPNCSRYFSSNWFRGMISEDRYSSDRATLSDALPWTSRRGEPARLHTLEDSLDLIRRFEIWKAENQKQTPAPETKR